MRTTQTKIFVAMIAALGLLAWALTADDARARVHRADPMLADDAKTWQTLVSDKEFAGMLKSLNADIAKSMKTSGTMMRSFKNLEMNGSLVALLGNIGTKRADGDDAKKAAALREAGKAFAKAAKAKKYADAQKHAKVIASYPSSIVAAEDGNTADWKETLPLGILMRGVSKIDNDANEAVTDADPKGFDKKARDLDLANRSVLLACLAVVAREHNDKADWKGWCDEFRAGAILQAREFGKKDQSSAKSAREKMNVACEACHKVYQDK